MGLWTHSEQGHQGSHGSWLHHVLVPSFRQRGTAAAGWGGVVEYSGCWHVECFTMHFMEETHNVASEQRGAGRCE